MGRYVLLGICFVCFGDFLVFGYLHGFPEFSYRKPLNLGFTANGLGELGFRVWVGLSLGLRFSYVKTYEI